MKKLLVFSLLLLSMAVQAQTARQFTIDLTEDGKAQMVCFLPEQSSGKAIVGVPGGGYSVLSNTHEGTQAWDLIKEVRVKYPDHLIFADVSNIEEAKRASDNGAEIVAPTLYGYTKETANIEGADYRMVAEMCREMEGKAVVIMEGHLYTPEDAMKCMFVGCHAVVVGSAITRPHYVAKRFVDALSGYRDDWRKAEKAKHTNELK